MTGIGARGGTKVSNTCFYLEYQTREHTLLLGHVVHPQSPPPHTHTNTRGQWGHCVETHWVDTSTHSFKNHGEQLLWARPYAGHRGQL